MVRSLALIDINSGNLVGSCPTLEDAMTIVRTSYADNALAGIRGLAILAVGEDGTQELISDDLGLLQQVIEAKLDSSQDPPLTPSI
jgi:hypothetical protein